MHHRRFEYNKNTERYACHLWVWGACGGCLTLSEKKRKVGDLNHKPFSQRSRRNKTHVNYTVHKRTRGKKPWVVGGPAIFFLGGSVERPPPDYIPPYIRIFIRIRRSSAGKKRERMNCTNDCYVKLKTAHFLQMMICSKTKGMRQVSCV